MRRRFGISSTSWPALRTAAALLCGAASVGLAARLAGRPPQWERFYLPEGSYMLETDQISPDGGLLVSIDLSGRPQISDRYRGLMLARCLGADTVTTSVQFSPDASHFVTTAIDGAIRFWEYRGGECRRIREISGTFPLYDANYSPDGMSLVTVGEAPVATLWDAARGEPKHQLQSEEVALVSASFSPTLPRVLTLSHDGDVSIWSSEDGALLAHLEGDAAAEWARFDSTGRAVLLGSQDGGAVGYRATPLWSAASLREPELWLLAITSLLPSFELARRLRVRIASRVPARGAALREVA